MSLRPGAAGPASAPASPNGFLPALPGYHFRFPRDGGAHPTYKTEWWYYTGHLYNSGREYGFELTFFRVGLIAHPQRRRSQWATSRLYLAHFALTDPGSGKFHFQERTDRGSLGTAGADEAGENVWIGDWKARVAPPSTSQTSEPTAPELWPHHIQANASFGSISLDLEPSKPPAIQGQQGISRKGPGVSQASHYYSFTRLKGRGELHINGNSFPVTATAWMDHEFGSSQLSADETGWDWFAIQLDDGWDLMLYQLRRKVGSSSAISPFSSGSLVAPDGAVTFLPRDRFIIQPRRHWQSLQSGATYPSGWSVEVPDARLKLAVDPILQDQELRTGATGVLYWEGATRIQGEHVGHAVSGQGYTELTGYGNALVQLR